MNNYKLTALIFTALLVATVSAQKRQSTNLEPVLIQTDPGPTQAGEDADITFKIRNSGNTEAEDVEVRIMNSFPFRVKPDRQQNYSLGSISPGEEYQISTEALVSEDAPDGQNSLKVRISHGGITSTRNIPVEVQSQDIELNLANLQTSPTRLTPDTEDATMNVELVNNGEKTAQNVVLDIGLPENFQETSSFSTRQSLGNVEAGQVKSAEFTFDVNDAESGEVEVPANISYTTGDSATIEKETGFSFYLSGKPQFEVTETETDLRTGTTGEIRITVRNTGDEEATSSRIRVLDSSDQPFSYQSASQFIGTLESGQQGTAVFEVDTEPDAEPKNYLIDFEIRGVKDTQVYVEDTTVQAQVEQGQRSSSLPLIPIAAVILVLIAAGYYFREKIRQLLP